MQKKKTEIFCDSSLRIGLELVSAKKTCINLTLVLSLGKCPALHSLEWIEVVETRPEFEDVHLCLIVFITFNLSCGFLLVVKKFFFHSCCLVACGFLLVVCGSELGLESGLLNPGLEPRLKSKTRFQT